MMYSIGKLILVTAGMGLVFSFGPALAQKTLDEQLLEDLEADPIDELDRELFAPEEKKTRGPEGGETLEGRLLRELGMAAESEDDPLLLQVARRMREAQQRMLQTDSSPQTQQVQEEIIAKLEELLKQARKSCGQCNAGSKKNPGVASRKPVKQPKACKPGSGKKPSSKPATNPNAKPGKAEAKRPDPSRLRQTLEQLWGALPERQRQQMLELPVEAFLPKYENMIEEYFRRLSKPREGSP